MRKAEKRRRGEERAQYWKEQTRETGLAAQKLDNKIRAARAERKAQEKKISHKRHGGSDG